MKKRIVALLLLVSFAAVIFSGCGNAKMKSPTSLMRPPLDSNINGDLRDAFMSSVTGKGKALSSSDVVLISPLTGDYRSAFVLHDIDNDGENEALVFYMLESEPTKSHVNILDFEGGKWTSVNDFSGSGTGVNFVRFVQMTESGCPVILVSQSLYESDSSKILSGYICESDSGKMSVKNVCTEVYSVMENIDVDGDGQLDVFIIQQDLSVNASPRSTAKAFKMTDNGTFEEFGSARLDGGISRYCAVQTEKITPSSPLKIYVDAVRGDGQAITEVIYWSSAGKALVTPVFNPETQSNMLTRRVELLAAQDYNGDGVIEIPSQHAFHGSRKYNSPKNLYEQMNVTSWIEVKSDKEYTLTDTLVNSSDSYIVYIDMLEKVMGSFTVYAYESTHMWVFKAYGVKYDYVGDDLFVIAAVSKETAEKDGISPENYLIEDEDTVVYFEARENGEKAGITAQSIKPCIKIFKVKELS